METFSQKIVNAIYTIGLSTTLIGGHMIASYFLLEPGFDVLSYFGYLVVGLFVLNTISFLGCVMLQMTQIADKVKIMKAGLGLLLNIPAAIMYLLIFIFYAS